MPPNLYRLRRNFLWGGSNDKSKISWVAWDKVVAPLKLDGLGLGSLRDANLAMLAKWWWRFKVEGNGLWRNVIWAIHHNSRSWSFIPLKVSYSGPWKQIHGISGRLGPAGIDLSSLISFSSYEDRWAWGFEGNGSFSVSSIKRFLSTGNGINPGYVFDWSKLLPKKVCVVAWRAEFDRLPTKAALMRRNIHIHEPWCTFCGEQQETAEHVLLSCHFAQDVWHVISQWCKIMSFFASDVRDLLEIPNYVHGPLIKKKVVQAVVHTTLWSLWRLRNSILFEHGAFSLAKVVEEIKILSFLWVSSRSRARPPSWIQWKRFDMSSLC